MQGKLNVEEEQASENRIGLFDITLGNKGEPQHHFRQRARTMRGGFKDMLSRPYCDLLPNDGDKNAQEEEQQAPPTGEPADEEEQEEINNKNKLRPSVVTRETYTQRARNNELIHLRQKIQDINTIIKVIRDIYCDQCKDKILVPKTTRLMKE